MRTDFGKIENKPLTNRGGNSGKSVHEAAESFANVISNEGGRGKPKRIKGR